MAEPPHGHGSLFLPDVNGRFGPYGGRYVPETLMFALRQLTEQYDRAREDPEFQKQIDLLLQALRRPAFTALLCRAPHARSGRARIYLKREDLNHNRRAQDQQLHRQALLTRRMGQAAGHRGDRRRPARRRHRHCRRSFSVFSSRSNGRGGRPPPAPHVFKMKALGARLSGQERRRTLRDAINEGDARLMATVGEHALHHRQRRGPHPFP